MKNQNIQPIIVEKRVLTNKVETRSDSLEHSLALTFGNKFTSDIANVSVSTFYSCLNLICNTFSELPVNLYKITKGKHKQVTNSPILLAIFKNPKLNKVNLFKQLIRDLFIYGNSYVYIKRSQDGQITDLQYVQAGNVTVMYDETSDRLYYQATKITDKNIEPRDMIHLRRDCIDGYNGKPITHYASLALSLAKAIDKSEENYFNSGAMLSGLLSTDKPLTQKQSDDIINTWQRTYGDKNARGGIAILGGGMQYQPISNSAKDSMLSDLKDKQVEEICRFFNLAPSMIGHRTSGGYSASEQDALSFLMFCMQPLINLVESELTLKLCDVNEEIEIDESYLLRADKQATASYYSTLVKGGILTINEARQDLGYDAVDGGDENLIPYSNIQTNKVGDTSQINNENKTEK